jgi:glucosamine kinase
LPRALAGVQRRVIGIDCGGSATRSAVIFGGMLGERRRFAPLNAVLDSDARRRLGEIITAAGAEVAGVGLAGVRTSGGARVLGEGLCADTGAAVFVFSDVEAGLAGAFGGGPGIVVVAGTGVAACGLGHSGERAFAGGHGFLLGDDGSAYWIGREALRLVLWRADRRGEDEAPSPEKGCGRAPDLREEIEAEAGCSLRELVAAIHAEPGDRRLLARLAPVVSQSADHGAYGILARAGDALGRLADTLTTRLGPLDVVGLGGVFSCPVIAARFAEARAVVSPQTDAALGAALLAVESLAKRPLSSQAALQARSVPDRGEERRA